VYSGRFAAPKESNWRVKQGGPNQSCRSFIIFCCSRDADTSSLRSPWHGFETSWTALGDRLTIRVLSKHDQPIASILTLSYKSTLVYKYGCSDARFHNVDSSGIGAMVRAHTMMLQLGGKCKSK
jgi:hypothetical protein